MKITCSTDEEQKQAGAQLASALSVPTKVLLSGDLGAGKTTFVQGVLKAMGYDGQVKSPTFTLVETYPTNPEVTHFDWYRIEHPHELENIGIWDYFDEPHHIFIEWPEKAPAYSKVADLKLDITYTSTNQRQISIEALTDIGQKVLNKWASYL